FVGKRDALEPRSIVVPNEAVSSGDRTHGIEVVLGMGPDTKNNVGPEPGDGQARERLAIVLENVTVCAGEERRAVAEGLNPPQVTDETSVLAFPFGARKMKHHRTLPVVCSHGPQVVRCGAMDGHEGGSFMGSDDAKAHLV